MFFGGIATETFLGTPEQSGGSSGADSLKSKEVFRQPACASEQIRRFSDVFVAHVGACSVFATRCGDAPWALGRKTVTPYQEAGAEHLWTPSAAFRP